VDSAGDLFTGNPSNSTVTEYSASGVTSTYATVDSVSGLTFSANGTLYGTSPNYNTVFLLNQQTHAYSDFASTPNANLFLPRGLVFDGSGNLYVANLGEFNNSGSFNNEGMTSPYANTIEKFSSTGTDLGAFATGLDEPYGLAFNLSGDLFVSNVGNNTIDEFSTGGGCSRRSRRDWTIRRAWPSTARAIFTWRMRGAAPLRNLKAMELMWVSWPVA
jgi:hypothetical protein